jgi:hypothetical protein
MTSKCFRHKITAWRMLIRFTIWAQIKTRIWAPILKNLLLFFKTSHAVEESNTHVQCAWQQNAKSLSTFSYVVKVKGENVSPQQQASRTDETNWKAYKETQLSLYVYSFYSLFMNSHLKLKKKQFHAIILKQSQREIHLYK